MPHGPRWLYERIRSQGFKLTLPRQLILDMLNKTKHHLSADEIYIFLRRRYPQIGLTTVYRTLEMLVRLGLINKFDFGDGRFRYELKGKEEHHHHLICKECGKVIDYRDFIDEETNLVKKIEQRLSEKYGFKIESHQLRFYGICKDCKERRRV